MKYSGGSGAPANKVNPGDSPREIPAGRGFSVFYQGKTLLSRVDPFTRAGRLAAGYPLRERTLYFCPSPLYGYGLEVLLHRFGDSGIKNSAILCVEADAALYGISRKAFDETPELLAAISGGKFSGGDFRRVALTGISDPGELCAFVRETWGERVFRRIEVIQLSGGWQLFPRLYEDLVSTLRREIAVEWGNAMTLIRLGRLYARNFIRNLALLPESENIASLDFGTSPVLALGAGPSLDVLLGELARFYGGEIPRRAKRRFKIVCADTCLPALSERGILPDMAVILESQHWNLRDFIGERGRKIDAALDLSALPASARALGGKKFFFATPWTELKLFGRLGEAGLLPEMFLPMGSVGLSAVALALRLGSGPVLTGGLDFSFGADAYHARSTPGHGDRLKKHNRFNSLINAGAAFREGTFSASAKNGTSTRSDPAMRNYRNLFEREFGGNPRLFDIQSSGLPLGIKTLGLAEAFAILDAESHAPGKARFLSNTSADFQKEKIAAFARKEKETLVFLRNALTGETPTAPEQVEKLLDYADYLWAHFPECAGAGGRRPPTTDIGFLKRVRAEIDGFLECWEIHE